jgi:hypothetical protein
VLHYKEKWKQINHLHHRLHNKPQGCSASVASAAGPFTIIFGSSRPRPVRLLILKIKALLSSTSGTTCPSTQHHIPEDLNLQQHLCENLKSWLWSF